MVLNYAYPILTKNRILNYDNLENTHANKKLD